VGDVRLSDGRYELQGLLGQGGMAAVWRAYDSRLDVHRAVKILDEQYAKRRKLRARFRDEAQLMAKLHHNHITTVHDVIEEGNTVYIVMELVEGGALIDRLKRKGPLTPRQASEVMQAVLAALHLAHKRGIVHRDIKPHNILLTSDGTAKVTDFGIAQIAGADTRTRTGATMGTLHYMPPEQRLDAKRVDHRADIYSCGVTLYTLVNGTEPKEDLYIAEPGGPIYGILPPSLAEVVRVATRYRQEDRFESADDMRRALKKIHAQLPDVAGEPLGQPMPDEKSGSWGPTLEPPLSNPPAATFGFEEVVVERETPAPARPAAQPEPEPVAESSPGLTEPPSTPDRKPLLIGVAVLALLGVGAWAFSNTGETPDIVEEEPVEVLEEEPQPEPVEEPEVEVVEAEPEPEPELVEPEPEPEVVEPAPVVARPRPERRPDPVVAEPEPEPVVTEPVAATTTGRLMVNSLPWSNVSVDGTGKGPTDWAGELDAGAHNLVLRTGDGRVKRATVTVPSNDVLRYCWNFDEGTTCSR